MYTLYRAQSSQHHSPNPPWFSSSWNVPRNFYFLVRVTALYCKYNRGEWSESTWLFIWSTDSWGAEREERMTWNSAIFVHREPDLTWTVIFSGRQVNYQAIQTFIYLLYIILRYWSILGNIILIIYNTKILIYTRKLYT